MHRLIDVIDMEPLGADTFRGPGLRSQIQRTFGGQVVAQALQAMQLTVEDKLAHSFHGYFVAAARSADPIDWQVERIREGRSFSHRQVIGKQGGDASVPGSGKVVFRGMAGFHIAHDAGPEHADVMPQVPRPEELDRAAAHPGSARIVLGDWDEWDIRMVPDPDIDLSDPNAVGAGFRHVWFRNRGAETVARAEDQLLQRSALAYMSDMTLLRSALIPHRHLSVQLTSLDHALWFFRPFRVDEWLLFVQHSPSARNGTALTEGGFFDMQGNLVARVVQEGVTRLSDM